MRSWEPRAPRLLGTARLMRQPMKRPVPPPPAPRPQRPPRSSEGAEGPGGGSPTPPRRMILPIVPAQPFEVTFITSSVQKMHVPPPPPPGLSHGAGPPEGGLCQVRTLLLPKTSRGRGPHFRVF